MSGSGIISDPWDLATALTGGFVQPGATLYLRGGTYSGDFTCSMIGTAANPIKVKAYPGEVPVISGDMTINGAYTYWYDIEFAKLDWANRVDYPEDDLMAYATRGKLINCNIHDLYLFGAWADWAEVYGCIIWNNGVEAGSHSLYTQNTSSTNRKTIKHNIIGKSFNFNLHAYSQTEPNRGFDIVQNALMQGNHLYGGTQADLDVLFDQNYSYKGILEVGYSTDQNSGAVLTGNYLYHPANRPLQFQYWEDHTVTGNTLIAGAPGDQQNLLVWYQATTPGSQTWNNNAYYNLGSKAEPFNEETVDTYSFADWKTRTGFDAGSTHTTSAPADTYFVHANDYASESKRKGLLVIYNHSQANSVSVDLSSLGLSNGTYRLVQATDPLVDVTEFSYTGAAVSVNMQAGAHTVAVPIQHSVTIIDETFPLFGAFMIEEV